MIEPPTQRQSWKDWRVLASSMVLAALVFAPGCGKEEELPPQEPKALTVKMFRLGEEVGTGSLEYPGRVEAWIHSEMAFEVPGKIVEFNVVEGDRVTKGDVLVALDPRDFQADLQEARATLAQAKADYERYQKLYAEGVSAKSELDAKEEHFKVSQAGLQRGQKALDDAKLIAPFDGMMARKLVDDFQNVRAKQGVLILQDVTRLKLRTAVPESDLATAEGNRTREELNDLLRAYVVVSGVPKERFSAKLGELSLTADETTRTFDATFYFDPQDGVTVLPGMTAKVVVAFPEYSAEVHLVPGTAVFADDSGNSHVWKIRDDKTVTAVPVVQGPMRDSRVEIRGEFDSGDVIVTSGINELREGRLVREYKR